MCKISLATEHIIGTQLVLCRNVKIGGHSGSLLYRILDILHHNLLYQGLKTIIDIAI